MKKFFCALVAIIVLPSMVSCAAKVPVGWVKLDGENKVECVEYATIKGEQYCSPKPMTNPQNAPEVKGERAILQFDKRQWKAGWAKNEPSGMYSIEYVPDGQTVENWHELVTSQYYPGLQNKMTPRQFMQNFIGLLKSQNYNPIVSILSEEPSDVVFEFRVTEPAEQAQSEIQRIVTGKDGLYVLHYAIKNPDMGNAKRQQWQGLLEAATFKN